MGFELFSYFTANIMFEMYALCQFDWFFIFENPKRQFCVINVTEFHSGKISISFIFFVTKVIMFLKLKKCNLSALFTPIGSSFRKFINQIQNVQCFVTIMCWEAFCSIENRKYKILPGQISSCCIKKTWDFKWKFSLNFLP